MHNTSATTATQASENGPINTETKATSALQNATPPKRHAIYVRISPEEHQRLIADAETFGKSAPDLLREVYFQRPQATPLLAKSDTHTVIVALSRIGNNLNQIARQVNSGGRQGVTPEFTALAEEVMVLNTVLRAICEGLAVPTSGG